MITRESSQDVSPECALHPRQLRSCFLALRSLESQNVFCCAVYVAHMVTTRRKEVVCSGPLVDLRHRKHSEDYEAERDPIGTEKAGLVHPQDEQPEAFLQLSSPTPCPALHWRRASRISGSLSSRCHAPALASCSRYEVPDNGVIFF